MRNYSNIISLSKNDRGIWDLDTIKGCKSGLEYMPKGCYNDCYSYRIAKAYGIDFSKSVLRDFESELHRLKIVKQIERVDMPFIRIGCSGDPSENWIHTISIINKLKNESQLSLFDLKSNKQIVIITRHWSELTQNQLNQISKFNLCINTSVSALDTPEMVNRSLSQYNRLKPYCKSVLRVITCDFNVENDEGLRMSNLQSDLLRNDLVINTVFRPSAKSDFITKGIIKVEKKSFMKKKTLMSKAFKNTYTGKCGTCLEMCGVNI